MPAFILYKMMGLGVPIGLGVERILKTGLNGLGFLATFMVMLNIFPALIAFKILTYRVGYDSEAIYVRPFPRSGPYLRMRFDEIERVDLQSWLNIYKNWYGRQKNKEIANILICQKGYNKKDSFIIVSSRLHGRQLKALVQMIYDKRPETFSKSMLRYLKGDNVYPPYAYAFDEINGRSPYRW